MLSNVVVYLVPQVLLPKTDENEHKWFPTRPQNEAVSHEEVGGKRRCTGGIFPRHLHTIVNASEQYFQQSREKT